MPGSVALRAVGRAPGDCVQIAPTDAEIVQFPVAQLAQFRQCEPVDAPLLHCGDNGVENTGDAVERTCFDCMGFGCDSHSLTHFQRFPGSGLMPVSDAPKIGICCTCTIPELVNAAMQKTHMSAGRGEDRASGTSAGKRPVHNGVSASQLVPPGGTPGSACLPPGRRYKRLNLLQHMDFMERESPIWTVRKSARPGRRLPGLAIMQRS